MRRVGRLAYLLNSSLVFLFQGSSPLSAGDAILSIACAAAHLRGTAEGGCLLRGRGWRRGREDRCAGWCSDVQTSVGQAWSYDKIGAPAAQPCLAAQHIRSAPTWTVDLGFTTASMFTSWYGQSPDCQSAIGIAHYGPRPDYCTGHITSRQKQNPPTLARTPHAKLTIVKGTPLAELPQCPICFLCCCFLFLPSSRRDIRNWRNSRYSRW